MEYKTVPINPSTAEKMLNGTAPHLLRAPQLASAESSPVFSLKACTRTLAPTMLNIN